MNNSSLTFLVSILIFSFFSCFGQKGIAEKISKNICKENSSFYQSKDVRQKEKLANEYRKKLIDDGVLDFISNEEEIYILEGYDLETGETYVTIWNEKNALSYKYDLKSYEVSDEIFISKKLKLMLTRWELNKIKKESKGRRAITGGLDMGISYYKLDKKGRIKNIKRDSFEEFDDTDWE